MGGILGGSGSGGGSSTTVQKNELDPEIKARFLQNVDRATGVAENLGAQTFAPRTGDYTAGSNILRNTATNSPGFGSINYAAGLTGNNATTSSVDNINKYLNPYTDYVAGNTVNNLARANQIALNGVAGDATMKGAYGGSRSGVAQAETNRNFFNTLGTTLGDIYGTGYNNAVNASNTDLNRQLVAANQLNTIGSNQIGQGYTAGQTLGNLGLSDQDYQQKILDAQRNLPLEQQAVINQALGLNPAGGSGQQGQSNSNSNQSSSQGTGLFGLFR
jgi:hypothetical protein